MKNPLNEMFADYKLVDQQAALTALKEIIQKIVLLGLWRQKFFERAAFYGGTALRLLYGLPRFSEDLDFSLLRPEPDFFLQDYFAAVQRELSAYGITAEIQEKPKQSAVNSAFVKTNTIQHLIKADIPAELLQNIPGSQLAKVKFEVDTLPPAGFATEVKPLLEPLPFNVLTYDLASLFAGKMHAVLCRNWRERVKGRDWYDLIWFVRKQVPLNIKHLTARLQQSGHYDSSAELTGPAFLEILKQRIAEVDFQKAKTDVTPFIKDVQELQLWSPEFFVQVADKIIVE